MWQSWNENRIKIEKSLMVASGWFGMNGGIDVIVATYDKTVLYCDCSGGHINVHKW